MISDAVLIQHVYSTNNTWFGNTFADMQRLIYPRHSAYCIAHHIDFWSLQGGKYPEMGGEAGAWMKVGLIRDALKDYEYVFWVDVDAAIMDFETDLRDSVKGINIGACSHNPDKSEWLKKNQIDEHINVGAFYVRNTETSKLFIDKWLESYPGPKRWADQGAFNEIMKEMPEAVTTIDDKCNATVNVNMVDNPVVLGWHGVPITERFLLMKNKLKDDHLIFTV